MNFFKYLKKKKITKEYKKFNNILFKKNNKSNNIILIEFNHFQSFHIIGSQLANFLSKKKNSKIVAIYNFDLVGTSLKKNFIFKIKFYLGSLLGINFFGIYKSFGVESFVYPKINSEIYLNANKYFKEIWKDNMNEDDVQKININNIQIGDLILDSYIKYYKSYEIEVNSDLFKKYVLDFISLYLFWKKFVDQNINNIQACIGAHAYFSYAIIHRICCYNNIPSYINGAGRICNLSKDNIGPDDQYKFFTSIYNKFNLNQKSRASSIATKFVKKKISGEFGFKINEATSTRSVFSEYDKNKSILKKNDKLKILIATHEIYDACHVFGNNFYPTFKSWLYSLGKISEKTDYDWYIKDHPLSSGLKMEGSQLLTKKLTKEITSKFKNINYLQPNISHLQLINEKIDYVLTVYGTIVYEYAYFDIPVILATKNHHYKDYNFYIQPKSREDYENMIYNLKKNYNKSFSKQEIYEYYFMKFIFNGVNNVLYNYSDFLKNHSYDEYDSVKFYKYFMESHNSNKLKDLNKKLELFINSKDFFLNPIHNGSLEDFLTYEENKIR